MNVFAWLPLFALGAAEAPEYDYEIRTLVLEAQDFPGGGRVWRIQDSAVSAQGNWVVVARLIDHPENKLAAVYRDDEVVLLEGDEVPGTGGGTLYTYPRSPRFEPDGDLVWVIPYEKEGAFHGGIFWNDVPLLLTEDVPLAAGFPPHHVFGQFGDVRINRSGDILVHVTAVEPGTSNNQGLLMRIETDGDGNVLDQSVVARPGDEILGAPSALHAFEPGGMDIDDDGSILYQALFDPLPGTFPLTRGIVRDSAAVVMEGDLHPETGEDYELYHEVGLSLHDGQAVYFAFFGEADGPEREEVLLRNGQVIRREGDDVPGVPGADILTLFVQANGLDGVPVEQTDSGSVLWYARWSSGIGGGVQDEGLFLDDRPILLEGVTQLDGVQFMGLPGSRGQVGITPDERYIIFEGSLGPREGAFLMTPKAQAVAELGCAVTPATLVASADPELGSAMAIVADVAQEPGALVGLLISTRAIDGYPPCGLEVPGLGELIADLSPPNPVVVIPGVWDGSPSSFHLLLPEDDTLLGLQLYAQALFYKPDFVQEPYRLTPGLQLTLGH